MSAKKGPFQKEMSLLTEDVRSFFRSVLIIFTAPAFDKVFFFFQNLSSFKQHERCGKNGPTLAFDSRFESMKQYEKW